MKLERELRHKSEDISDDVLSDTVKALGRRVRVSHDYDIPYIAGYSADGRTVSRLHLRVLAHVPTTACRGRHATPLPRQHTLGSSDGPHHRASWLSPATTGPRPKHRASCCPGKSAHTP